MKEKRLTKKTLLRGIIIYPTEQYSDLLKLQKRERNADNNEEG